MYFAESGARLPKAHQHQEDPTLKSSTTWKALVRDVIERLPKTFTLRDVEAHRDYFAKHYPDNRFIEAKIRQSLQILRDQGFIAFLGSGRYERTGMTQPLFSPFFDASIAQEYTSKARAAGVAVETWAEHNLYCLSCSADELSRLPTNAIVADLECLACTSRYQIKAKNGRFGAALTGAAYEPILKAIRAGAMPSYVLVEYDPRFNIVVFVEGVPGRYIDKTRVIPRKPLSATARRAGWRGCTISLAGLHDVRVRIVEPSGRDRLAVREEWRKLSLSTGAIEATEPRALR
jgi:hypothetical protein